jgi:predicted PhzF superfamily epimerase YddE/YHI9
VCALGGYLGMRDGRDFGLLEWSILQGEDMGRQSRIELAVEKRNDALTAVRVGGRSVLFSSGTVEL